MEARCFPASAFSAAAKAVIESLPEKAIDRIKGTKPMYKAWGSDAVWAQLCSCEDINTFKLSMKVKFWDYTGRDRRHNASL